MSHTMDVISDIVVLLSKQSGCDVVCSGYDVINIVSVRS